MIKGHITLKNLVFIKKINSFIKISFFIFYFIYKKDVNFFYLFYDALNT